MSRPAVFLDRDGTIIVEASYLADPDGVELVAGASGAMRALHDAGFALVVVTNQSGIGRGLYTLDQYVAVAERLDVILEREGVVVDATEFCPHHPDTSSPCDCRKPGTAMHRRAAAALDLDLGHSFYVGDKVSDVLPAAELGGQAILVRTGYGAESEARVPAGVWIADDLTAAAALILDAAERGPDGPSRR